MLPFLAPTFFVLFVGIPWIIGERAPWLAFERL
jgi:hypothetical protein